MLIVTLTKASPSTEAPITADYFIELIKDNVDSHPNSNDLIHKTLLPNLQKKSSKHKFVVQATTLKAHDADVNFQAGSSFGAVWDSVKDGYISVKVELPENQLVLITVFWLYT